jgi:hypothetical protein
MGNISRGKGPGERRRTGFSQMSCYLLWSKPRGFFGAWLAGTRDGRANGHLFCVGRDKDMGRFLFSVTLPRFPQILFPLLST